VNHLHQQPRVPWSILTTKVNVKNTFMSHIDKNIFDIVVDLLIFIHIHKISLFYCAHWIRRYRSRFYCSKCVCCIRLLTLLLCQDFFVFYWVCCCCWNDGMIFWKLKQTDFVNMYKDKEVNNNVKDIFVNVWHKSVFDIYFRHICLREENLSSNYKYVI
jgi:hypothetical protein